MRFPRLTFLARFTLVTLTAAVLASSVLALTLETLHQQAVERDEIVDALGELDARVAPALERYAVRGDADPTVPAAFRDTQRAARLHQYVADFRIYGENGAAIFPAGAAPISPDMRSSASDRLTIVEAHGVRTVYEPFATSNGRQFILAVDFLPDQFTAQFADERRAVVLATVAVIAVIAAALVALAAGASRELERRRRESQATFVQALTTLADTIDLRDPYTAGHSRRVAAYSRLLAEDLGVPAVIVDQIENGALMHDIGKIGVPDAVLFKPGPLDDEERMLIRGHPVIGAGILDGVPTLHDIVPCVLHHHERIDGTGYPDGLTGDDIPLGARIIAVADAFDAMTTDRPYRRGMSTTAAVEELLAREGTQFDRRCVLAFAELVMRGEIVPPPRATGTVSFGRRTVSVRAVT